MGKTDSILSKDKIRYGDGKPPKMLVFFRKAQNSSNILSKWIYRILFGFCKHRCLCDISINLNLGEGAYFGHPYCIVINPKTVIGKNVSIHNGVTIGKENRGTRKGTPIIGNKVWIGANAVIVGKITIGNDVLIAPNAFVNFDIPDHSIVIGNPAKIVYRKNATEHYSTNTV